MEVDPIKQKLTTYDIKIQSASKNYWDHCQIYGAEGQGLHEPTQELIVLRYLY